MAKFTDRYIQGLKSTEKMYQVREGHGFGMRVLPSGLKIWIYTYTLGGRRRQLNLGHYPHASLADARRKYLDAAGLVANGIDPQAGPEPSQPDPEPEEMTVQKLAETWLSEWSKHHHSTRWHYNMDRALENDVISAWGSRLAKDIRRRDAVLLLETVAKRAPGQARNVQKAAQGMFNYAVERELLDYNPFAEIRVSRTIPAMKQRSRKRTLSDQEIKHIWSAIDKGGGSDGTKRALKLILVTGQRPGEVCGLHTKEIDGKWWSIPRERIKTREKRDEDHRVFLSPLARQIIGDVKGHIAPSAGGESEMTENALAYHVRRTVANTGKETYYGLPRWTPHDLRRTMATGLASLGAPQEHIDAIQNHAIPGVSGIYNRYKYDKEKQLWLTKWAQHLDKLLKGKQAASMSKRGKKRGQASGKKS